jgi:ATP-dependent helicase IRC3
MTAPATLTANCSTPPTVLDHNHGVYWPPLRDYQHEALNAIRHALAQGVRRHLLVLPTGSGKTVLFAALIHDMDVHTLVLAHRDELIEQAVSKLLAAGIPADIIGVVKAERNDTAHPIIVASVQTLAQNRRLLQLHGAFGLVVVDEAHHALAASYRRILEHVGCFAPDGPLLLGVTATPDRGDGRPIGNTVFEELVYSKPILELMQHGYLCDVRAYTVRMRLSLAGVKTRHGDFAQGELAAVLAHAEAPRLIAEAYREHASDRKGIVFTPSVALAYTVCEKLQALGIIAEALDGTTPSEERKAILRRLRTGDTQVVANCAVLTEGFDEPSVSCIAVCRPTKSRPLFCQMIGRGLRPFPGKDNCLILDLGANSSRHDVVTVPDVFGIPDRELMAKASVLGAVRAVAEAAQLARERAELVARSVDLFNRSMPTARPWSHGLGLHWVGIGDNCGAVSIPDGYLVICPASSGYVALLCCWRQADELLGTAAELADAVRRAEAYIARRNLGYLARLNGGWRNRPASEKQLSFARRMGLRPPESITGGALSDWILLFQARRFACGSVHEVAV